MSKIIQLDKQKEDLEYWLSHVENAWSKIPDDKSIVKKINHIAFICDGNRRSARLKGLDENQGYSLGIEVIKGIAKACRQWGIKHTTFWTFSTENWLRSDSQVSFLMQLAKKYLNDRGIVDQLIENEVKFTHLGRKNRLSYAIRKSLINLEKQTASFEKYFLNMALDYGGIDELARAVQKILLNISQNGPIDIENNPEILLSYLDTRGQPFPDLVVRTGFNFNEVPRTSGFMPLQTSYSGWLFLECFFPDLTPEILLDEIKAFTTYEMRLGK